MEIRCPHCTHNIKVKSVKPGTHRPKCPKCTQVFELTVSAEEGAAPGARKLAEDKLPEEPKPPTSAKDQTLPDASTAATMVSASASSPGASTPGVSPPSTRPSASDATRADPTAATLATGTEATLAQNATTGFSVSGANRSTDAPVSLGGYRIVKELGRGAMGAVYLARQVSLDRNVALKVIQSRLASNPTFIARFTREAYAAAQLTHPNVVQIYDLGCDGDTYYFSMEFVDGESLGSLVQRSGKLDGEAAVRYVLQAARGLKFAHDQGLVHRDIKPDNLLLSKHGMVKIADLGLVKAVGKSADPPDPSASAESLANMRADITEAHVAMGTPAYMAPEQAEDASNVDHRADIYSLGCTLYVLLTGRPPFQGNSALDVITKHKTAPITRPDAVVKEVPKGLAEINMRMVAKKPDERYGDLSQAIQEMESYLGIQGKGPMLPQQENVAALSEAARQFYGVALAKLRGTIWFGLFGVCAAVFLVGLFLSPMVAGAGISLGVLTPLAHFLFKGAKERTFLFAKTRELLTGSSWGDRLSFLLGGLLFVAGLWLFGQLWIWIGVAAVAIAIGAGVYFTIDRKIESQRREPLDKIEQMLQVMRLRGLDEQTIHEFVATSSGQQWEELYESLFGYEAKLAARAQWAEGDERRRRDRFASWRDPLVRWIDGVLKTRKVKKDQKLLRGIEEKNLRAQGLSASEARQRAGQAAAALVHQAAEIRRSADQPAPADGKPQETPEQKRARIRSMVLAAQSDGAAKGASPLLKLLELALGGKTRFLAGGALLAAFFLWLQQQGLIPDRAKPLLDQALAILRSDEPLNLPMLPSLLAGWFGGANCGAAGLILALSAFIGRMRGSVLAIAGAAVALLALLPNIPGLDAVADGRTLSMAAGAALLVVGMLLGGGKKR